jgi:aspartokinase
MMDKLVHEMTSQELFDLAKSRKTEEAQVARRELRDELNSLRQERRDLEKDYKKAVSAIEKQIDAIREKMSPDMPTEKRRSRNNSGNVSRTVLETLRASGGQMTTTELHAVLNQAGFDTSNLSQTLSYLKRQQKVVSPARSVYQLVG